ncbi:hypothetical protein Mtc_2140 [Methanocella conradii HZ254]|uniref:Uncharacterized protein n=1 Tax=Methanocella conradii (strain DSM 24694 / JCM 17849 / CGMCC 1.5162 / HZ254) TaxID=1041930 RepID=H8I860_METCZ|nr:hypothetical protein [Methanocella conradii]AFD00878.1 hypothetical protein Mtc_2140 [Methanocella conradii HZ254]
MSKFMPLLALLIVAALIVSGCTGTRTMVGKENNTSTNDLIAAQKAAAQNEYKKSAGELNDEIDFLKNHYKPPQNCTLEDYRLWLDGFRDRLGLCRQMYDNVSVAAKKYLGYLNESSEEYANLTSEDTGFIDDINSLDGTYRQYSDYLNVTIKKMAALRGYQEKLNASVAAYNDLTAFSKGARVDSEDSYASFLDGFNGKVSAYESKANAAIAAGEEYLKYCEPGSAEYQAVTDNNNALRDNARKCREAYNNYKKDYDSKMSAKGAATSAFNDYKDKMGKASSAANELEAYRGTAKALEKLDAGWLAGYKERLDAFKAACNDAIAAGDTCKQYLDPSGSDYKSIESNEKSMKDAIASYESNYSKLNAMYRNLHPLGPIIQ